MKTTKEKDPTCAEEIMKHYSSRMKKIQLLFGSHHFPEDRAKVIEQLVDVGHELEADTTQEQIEEAISAAVCDYGLGFDYVEPDTWKDQTEGYFRYQLSWGGPSEEFRFYVSPVAEGQQFIPYKIEFWFMNWFDSAGYRVMNESLTRTDKEGTVTLKQIDERELLLSVFDWFQEIGATTV